MNYPFIRRVGMFIVCASFLFALVPFGHIVAHAQSGDIDVPQIQINKWQDITTKILCPIAKWAFNFFIVISVIMIIVTAYMYLGSGGDPTRVSTATKALTYTVVAIVVAILAFAVPQIVYSLFGRGGNVPSC